MECHNSFLYNRFDLSSSITDHELARKQTLLSHSNVCAELKFTFFLINFTKETQVHGEDGGKSDHKCVKCEGNDTVINFTLFNLI